MRIVVHLSDLHFGRVHAASLAPLRDKIREIAPHLVAVSGDVSQRAKRAELKEARAFLDELPRPQIVVPGNHDVPVYRFWNRALWPLRGFRRYVEHDLAPFFADEQMAVAGINTARAATTKHGRVNLDDVERVAHRFAAAGDVRKIVVTHHPFDLPPDVGGRLVGRAERAMERLADAGVDVFLAGHGHVSHHLYSSARYAIHGHSALVLQAGTATSTRRRGEPNAFNVLRLRGDEIEVDHLYWDGERSFEVVRTERSHHTAHGWTAVRQEQKQA